MMLSDSEASRMILATSVRIFTNRSHIRFSVGKFCTAFSYFRALISLQPAPNPRCGGGGFPLSRAPFEALSRAMEVVVSLFLARLNLLILPKLSILLNLANPPHNVFFALTHHTHRAHMHTSPLCVFLCVCVPNPRLWVG